MKVVRTQTLDIKGLGNAIKTARKNDERPLTEICSLINMTTSNWYRIESENQSLPLETLRQIEKILDVNFGISFDEL